MWSRNAVFLHWHADDFAPAQPRRFEELARDVFRSRTGAGCEMDKPSRFNAQERFERAENVDRP